MTIDVKKQVAAIHKALDGISENIVAIEAAILGVVADVPADTKPKPNAKVIDWTLTGLATTAYHTATGKWVEIKIYSDGTREGPEVPATPVGTDPKPKPDEPKPADPPKPDPKPAEPVPTGGAEVWSGIATLRHRYGRTWEHDGQLDVASWAGEGFSQSGAMQKPKEDGQGYGVYTMEMSGSKSNAPGKFACIWPKDDVWKFEIDIVENDFNGNAISTLHWGGDTGHDQSEMKWLEGVRADERHVYETTWSRDLIVIKVDGVEKARFTEHVPRDASDGGTDGLMGIGTQPAWAAQAQTGDQVFTLHSCSYRKLG